MGPVFLQSLWRSCSTYFWTKFRENPDWRCYKEPLHETLLVLKKKHSEKEQEYLRHPVMEEPYFAEYPLRHGGGVSLFQERFPASDYFLRPEDKDEDLRRYFQNLIDYAAENMQRPFFQPNRAVLRGEWLRKSFGGAHLYLNRNIESLIGSYYSFGANDSYFLRCYAAIVGQNAGDSFFREIADHKGLEPCAGSSFLEELEHFGRMTTGWGHGDFREIVTFVWAAGLAQASRYADGLIEVSRLADSSYREFVRAIVMDSTGSDLDLSDFDIALAGGGEAFIVSQPARGIISRALEELEPDWGRLEKLGAAPATKRFLSQFIS